MISKMQKLLLVAPEVKKDEILTKLQKIGVVEVAPYKGSLFTTDGRIATTAKADAALSAIKTLDKYAAIGEKLNFKKRERDFQSKDLINEINNLALEYRKCEDETAACQNGLKSLENLGDFSLDDIKKLEDAAHISIQFWSVSQKAAAALKIENVIADFEIFADESKKIFMTLAKEPLIIPKCQEIVVEKDSAQLRDSINKLNERKGEILQNIVDISTKREDLYRRYLFELDQINFNRAARGTINEFDNKIFLLEAWCPTGEMKTLEQTYENERVAIIPLEPEKDDKIPTLIEPRNRSDLLGRDLVNIYDTPAYTDWDPSSWVFFSFTLFFAMIVADGGYGLLLLGLMIFLKIKIKKAGPALKRFINLSMALSGATALYGIISGGFFGFDYQEPVAAVKPLTQFLNHLKFIDSGDTQMMMMVSVVIGMLHISISLLLRGFRALKDERNPLVLLINIVWIVGFFSFFFWYAFDKGGSAVIKVDNPAVFSANGLLGLEISAIILALLYAIQAKTLNPFKMLFSSFSGLYNSVQFFSDVLSYIRIFALGLSGALLAQTFNNLASQLWDIGVIGIILAPFVFILGHLLNIALCLMSGVIHGLRLNFLEWYRWSFDGGGRRFIPFKDMLAAYAKGDIN